MDSESDPLIRGHNQIVNDQEKSFDKLKIEYQTDKVYQKIKNNLGLFVIILVGILIFTYIYFENELQEFYIRKPLTDKRNYKYVELANQIKVLIIEDQQAQNFELSLNINSGSINDPEEALGLSHLLEHVIMSGSSKGHDRFQDYISDVRGDFQAHTELEYTNFYYSVSDLECQQSVRRFSYYFIDPFVYEDNYKIDEMIQKIQNEYLQRLQDPRFQQLFVSQLLSNPDSQFSRFSIGNFNTLKPQEDELNLYSQLKAFYKKYYSSNLMTLVIKGKQSIRDYEQIIQENFSSIRNKKLSQSFIDLNNIPFKTEFLGIIFSKKIIIYIII